MSADIGVLRIISPSASSTVGGASRRLAPAGIDSRADTPPSIGLARDNAPAAVDRRPTWPVDAHSTCTEGLP